LQLVASNLGSRVLWSCHHARGRVLGRTLVACVFGPGSLLIRSLNMIFQSTPNALAGMASRRGTNPAVEALRRMYHRDCFLICTLSNAVRYVGFKRYQLDSTISSLPPLPELRRGPATHLGFGWIGSARVKCFLGLLVLDLRRFGAVGRHGRWTDEIARTDKAQARIQPLNRAGAKAMGIGCTVGRPRSQSESALGSFQSQCRGWQKSAGASV
jgi:hypothetical protein